MKYILQLFVVLLFSFSLQAQQYSLALQQRLKEVVVSSSRIDVNFSENSRSINLISAQELKASGALTDPKDSGYTKGLVYPRVSLLHHFVKRL